MPEPMDIKAVWVIRPSSNGRTFQHMAGIYVEEVALPRGQSVWFARSRYAYYAGYVYLGKELEWSEPFDYMEPEWLSANSWPSMDDAIAAARRWLNAHPPRNEGLADVPPEPPVFGLLKTPRL